VWVRLQPGQLTSAMESFELDRFCWFVLSPDAPCARIVLVQGCDATTTTQCSSYRPWAGLAHPMPATMLAAPSCWGPPSGSWWVGEAPAALAAAQPATVGSAARRSTGSSTSRCAGQWRLQLQEQKQLVKVKQQLTLIELTVPPLSLHKRQQLRSRSTKCTSEICTRLLQPTEAFFSVVTVTVHGPLEAVSVDWQQRRLSPVDCDSCGLPKPTSQCPLL
jgi:hypothetical protein